MTPEMRGPRGVRAAVAAFYRAQLPRHVEACRLAWDLLDEELPVPLSRPDDPKLDAYYDKEPPAIDRWPLLGVTSGRRVQRAVDFTDSGEPQFRCTYPVRVWTWVRAEGRAATTEMRDDLATAVTVTALSHVTLDSLGGWLTLQPSTLATEYSRVEKVQGDRFIAGSYVAFDLHALETLTDRLALPGAQPRDTVTAVSATGTPLPAVPPHPALL